MGTSSVGRALAAISLAVGCGGAAVVILVQTIEGYQDQIEQAQRPEELVTVMVARHDLYPGVVIEPDDLMPVEIEPRFLHEGVYLGPDHVVGQRPRERILADELVRSGRLVNPETGSGLNTLIPQEMRAISVEVKDGAALSGHLYPGSYVDVIVTTRENDGGQVRTFTPLHSMFVLAVNRNAVRGDTGGSRMAAAPAVTLLATPAESKKLAHAAHVGEIQLSLRNDMDAAAFFETTGFSLFELEAMFGKLPPPPKPVKRVKKKKMPAPVEPEQTMEQLQIEVERILGDKRHTDMFDE